jgi:hypothetical protein
MSNHSKLVITTVLGAGLLSAGAPAYAVTLEPFAAYTMKGTKTTVEWQETGPTNGSIFSTTAGGATPSTTKFVTFNFLNTSKFLSGLKAQLTLGGSETGVAATGPDDQSGIGGSFTFTYEGPTTSFMGRTYTHDVTNLLTGVFSLAHITGAGTSGSFHDSTDIGSVVYTSDIIDFSKSIGRDFSYSLASISPALGFTPGQSLDTFNAGATGIFSAAFVPEPAVWTMMLIGFGGLGAMMRSRRRALSA